MPCRPEDVLEEVMFEMMEEEWVRVRGGGGNGDVGAMHGPLYTVEGPAGTGKSHAMLALAMMDLGDADFKYPVHSQDFPGNEWCSLFTNWHKSNEGEAEPINIVRGSGKRMSFLTTYAVAIRLAKAVRQVI
ncbi:hypothetical protein N7516_008453 [Penicillium verrucosum]|uniref:uncharacterized protein n=1 Tax=Penicillium verrucosum TaxID=60171 RepID=UPI0025450D84|nr:uncharacterized protein N7516_008453 [Penicillium verrucosum]KAJ5926680.1 hypothetical protein N7516_008453 [Penicillium verrucosum]